MGVQNKCLVFNSLFFLIVVFCVVSRFQIEKRVTKIQMCRMPIHRRFYRFENVYICKKQKRQVVVRGTRFQDRILKCCIIKNQIFVERRSRTYIYMKLGWNFAPAVHTYRRVFIAFERT